MSTILTGKNFFAEQKFVASDHYVWRCKDLKTQKEFLIHVMDRKKLYITFFRSKNKSTNKKKVKADVVIDALRAISDLMKENGEIPEIKIEEENYSLKRECQKAGFVRISKTLYKFF